MKIIKCDKATVGGMLNATGTHMHRKQGNKMSILVSYITEKVALANKSKKAEEFIFAN